jgi:hypothetical protein
VSKIKPKIVSQRNKELSIVEDEEPEWINQKYIEGENRSSLNLKNN